MKLHSREWGSGDRVAVLLHGMQGSADSWWQVGPALASRGYRAIALDLPGHGHSPRCPQATRELFALSVLESVPARPALALGHSMGGSTLARAVSRLQPERAVYIDHPFYSTRTPPVDRVALTAESEASKARRTPSYLRSTRTWWREEDVLAEAEAARNWDVPTAVSLWADAAGTEFIPTTSVPSLMIRADPSENVSPSYALELAGLGFTVRSVPGAGHSVWYGFFDEFMAVLDGWLAEPV